MDRSTKSGHFIAIAHPYTTKFVAQCFLDNVFKLHGMPASIVSDRGQGSHFLEFFWQELYTLRGVLVHKSTAYHTIPKLMVKKQNLVDIFEKFLL